MTFATPPLNWWIQSLNKDGLRFGGLAVAGAERLESACGYKQTSSRPKSMSALPPKADIPVAVTDFRF